MLSFCENSFDLSWNLLLHTYLMVIALNDLQEDCGSVLNRFSEDLEQIAFLIKVNKDFQFL